MNANVFKCGSWLKFRHYTDLEKNTLYNARFCKKDKICPACAARRAAKQVRKVYSELYSNPELLEGYWYYIVVPVHHNASEEFGTVFDRLQLAIKRINQAMRDVQRGRESGNWFTHFDGIMYSIEETKTANGWNIHANLLCRSDKPLKNLKKKKGFNRYWHIEAADTLRKIADGSQNISISPINVSNKEDLIKNLQEIFKYSLKFQELNPDDLLTAYRGLYRKRLLGTMGTLRGLNIDISFEDDDIQDEIFIETMYHYVNKYIIRPHRIGKVYKDGYAIYSSEFDYSDDQDTEFE
jgi:hypothetical protein